MCNADTSALETMLGQLRAIHEELAERHAGIAVLHIDAATAALESQIRRLAAIDAGRSAGGEARAG